MGMIGGVFVASLALLDVPLSLFLSLSLSFPVFLTLHLWSLLFVTLTLPVALAAFRFALRFLGRVPGFRQAIALREVHCE